MSENTSPMFPRVTEIDVAALEKAKRLDEAKKKKGYRWVKVNDRLQVLVPCGKDGKPTKNGQKCIDKFINRI